jgi:hypothetical protein
MATHRPTLPPNRGARDWDAAIADAKRHAGNWVPIFEQAPRSTPNAVKRGAVNVLKDPRWNFELATRNTNGSRADIWMRATRVTAENPKTGPLEPPRRGRRKKPPAIEAQEPDQATQMPEPSHNGVEASPTPPQEYVPTEEFVDVPPAPDAPTYPIEADLNEEN